METADDMTVVGEADNGQSGLDAVARYHPDVVLMDIRMSGLDGLSATEALQGRPHPPAVIVLTTFDTDDTVLRALQAGATGYLLKDPRRRISCGACGSPRRATPCSPPA